MNAAREQAAKEQIKQGLLKLASSGICTRIEAFGRIPDRTSDYMRISRVLEKLSSDGIIESTDTKPGEPKLHEALDAAKLRAIANDDLELVRLIWPGRTGPRAPIQDPATTEAPTEQTTEALPSRDSITEAMLKMLVALTENVIYLREQVDALNSVACSHCTNPEAHR